MPLRSLLFPLMAALALALGACGGDDGGGEGGGEPSGRPASLAQIASGEVAPGTEVRLTAPGYPVGEAGFVLAQGGRAVFVDAARTPSLKIDPGETVEVTGRVREQDGSTAIQLESALENPREQQGTVAVEALRAAPVGRGEPYVELVPGGLSAEGG